MTLDIDFSRSNLLIFLQSVKVKNSGKLVPLKAVVKVVEVVVVVKRAVVVVVVKFSSSF